MSELNQSDIWQVEVNGQIYEAPFDEMASWIAEGALHRSDKVRKGNLRWIEAGRVPSLISFFNAKESGAPISPIVSTTVEQPAEVGLFQAPVENFAPVMNVQVPVQNFVPDTPTQVAPSNLSPEDLLKVHNPVVSAPIFSTPVTPNSLESGCTMHPGVPSRFVCDTCASLFCRECPNSYGGSVKVCPLCGAMCKPVAEVSKAINQSAKMDSALREGYGFLDFGRALIYPFRFKLSLVIGSIMFALFSYGQMASSIGGFALMGGALFCMLGANMLTFGILANTVENFSQGKVDLNFFPAFDGFSIWEDVVEPFFLSIAAYVVSFGLFAALLIGSLLYFYSMQESPAPSPSGDAALNAIMPGAEIDVNAARQVPQIDNVRQQLNKTNRWKNGGAMPSEAEIAQDQTAGRTGAAKDDFQIAQDLVDQRERTHGANGSNPLAPGTTADSPVPNGPVALTEDQQMYRKTVEDTVRKTGILGLLMLLALVWGFFYFPAACAVAGYTRSIAATLNPMVGLDTIKRLGSSYFKILGFGIIVAIMSGVFTGIIHSSLSSFNLPKVGNVPASLLSSVVAFYFSIVFSCLIGFALYKRSDKLNLFR